MVENITYDKIFTFHEKNRENFIFLKKQRLKTYNM